VLSVQTSNAGICRSTGNGLDGDMVDDRDPRDVTNNSFNRFDPKYISIGPKAVRGQNNNLNIMSVAGGANKCATLRHVGRYGGSLKGVSAVNATPSPAAALAVHSPNLRSAKTPSIATVSKDYCQQPDCIPQELHLQQQQQHQRELHPPTTHILPASAVYSIESSEVLPTAAPRAQQRSLNPASIVNQPLPEIPTNQQQSKISAQPLCAASLGQYRSLQRPQTQKLQPAAISSPQQPPTLPPKNRHKNCSSSFSSNSCNSNNSSNSRWCLPLRRNRRLRLHPNQR